MMTAMLDFWEPSFMFNGDFYDFHFCKALKPKKLFLGGFQESKMRLNSKAAIKSLGLKSCQLASTESKKPTFWIEYEKPEIDFMTQYLKCDATERYKQGWRKVILPMTLTEKKSRRTVHLLRYEFALIHEIQSSLFECKLSLCVRLYHQ